MVFSDMDMLQDYEKDARMAALAYTIMLTDTMDNTLRTLFAKAASAAEESQKLASNLIMARGDRP